MTPGQRFTKTWTILNAGSVLWRDRRLTRVGMSAGAGLITTPMQVSVPDAGPGDAVAIAVPCVAQIAEGTSVATLKMTDPAGRLYFRDRNFIGLQAQVVVVRGITDRAREGR